MPSESWPEWTIFTSPGGSSSTGQTSRSAKGQIIEAGGFLGKRRPLPLVERDLERPEPEQRALEPDRRKRDPDLVEELVLRERGDLGRAPPLHHLHQHRGRRLADRAPAAGELDLFDRVAVGLEADVDRDLVAAERVLAVGARVGVVDHPVSARVLVVVEDDLAVELVELAHAKSLRASCTPSASRSTSSGRL